MSRPMKGEEIDAFEKKYGYKPTEIKVAIDALAVFAHKDNPLKGLTMQQVDGISPPPARPAAPTSPTGASSAWMPGKAARSRCSAATAPPAPTASSRNTPSPKATSRPTVKEQPGSSAVVQGVGGRPLCLGYSGIGYATSGVRALPLGTGAGSFAEASYENCLSGDYPLARFLLIYTNKKPNTPMDKLTFEFVKFVLSKEGQEVVVKDGYYPMPAELAAEVVKSLE
jgi:phosphate transport system substrate-binding protein